MIRQDLTKAEVCQRLYSFQIRPNRPGFFYTVQAVLQIASLPDESGLSAGDLYRRVAALYHVSEEAVEHDINATLHNIWRHNPELLSRLAARPLSQAPPPLDFLRLLASATPNPD